MQRISLERYLLAIFIGTELAQAFEISLYEDGVDLFCP